MLRFLWLGFLCTAVSFAETGARFTYSEYTPDPLMAHSSLLSIFEGGRVTLQHRGGQDTETNSHRFGNFEQQLSKTAFNALVAGITRASSPTHPLEQDGGRCILSTAFGILRTYACSETAAPLPALRNLITSCFAQPTSALEVRCDRARLSGETLSLDCQFQNFGTSPFRTIHPATPGASSVATGEYGLRTPKIFGYSGPTGVVDIAPGSPISLTFEVRMLAEIPLDSVRLLFTTSEFRSSAPDAFHGFLYSRDPNLSGKASPWKTKKRTSVARADQTLKKRRRE